MSYEPYPDPCGLSETDRLYARLDAEHRAGLHAADPHGDCDACSSDSGPEGVGDPFTAHLQRLGVPVWPWLVDVPALDLIDGPLGGVSERVGGAQGDLVAFRHGDIVSQAVTAAKDTNCNHGVAR